MTTSVKNNFLPPSLISSLQQELIKRNGDDEEHSKSRDSCASNDTEKLIILVTNGEGIESPGLTLLVEALVRVRDRRFDVYVCSPQSDKSVSGHSMTVRETLAVSSVEISGAPAYSVSGTPEDCVSLALSGALFSWMRPALVISGINKGSNCGHKMSYSGAFAAAREALICGVPSLCISMNWKQAVSCEIDLKDAASVCLPLINAAVEDIEKGIFLKSCLLNIDIPSCPLRNKGLKVTKQSMWRSSLSWHAVSANRHLSVGHFMSSQQSLGMKLAQLSRDASAAGAARRLNSHRKNVEIESVGVAGEFNAQQTVKKYFRLELLEKEPQNVDEDTDFQALEDGFVAITPFSLTLTMKSEVQTLVSNWISAAILGETNNASSLLLPS